MCKKVVYRSILYPSAPWHKGQGKETRGFTHEECFDTRIGNSALRSFFGLEVKTELEAVANLISVVHATVPGSVSVDDHPALSWC